MHATSYSIIAHLGLLPLPFTLFSEKGTVFMAIILPLHGQGKCSRFVSNLISSLIHFCFALGR